MRSLLFFILAGAILASCGIERKGIKAFRRGEYQNAIDLLRNVNSDDPGKINYYLAESYRLSNRINEAESFYAKAGGPDVNRDSVQLYYALALKANRKYDEANAVLSQLLSATRNEGIQTRAQNQLDGIKMLEEIRSRPNYYRVRNLEAINTEVGEYAPVYLNNELYFTSARGISRIYEGSGTPFTDIYKVSTQAANVDMSTLTRLGNSINDDNTNDGCVTFTPDGRIMVFAKGNTGRRKGSDDVDLYMSRFRNGQWSEPEVIPGSINSPKFWDSTPAFADERTIYFASNRDGGYGGTDIYSARMDSRGRFSRITNLGPEINTPGNELFPYVSRDGRMYFASDGHPGFGALDLFVVERENGKTVIRNLGEPMNSSADDFGIFLFDVDRGFFSSNREGGSGDDDIYTFVDNDPDLKVVNYVLAGTTYTPDKEGKLQVLPNTRVTLYDASNQVMSDYVTGNDGKFLFRVYENENYAIMGEADGYLVKRQPFTTIGKSVDKTTLTQKVTNVTFDTTLVLDKIEVNKIFILENIYYGYDSADIRPDAARELDKLVQILKDNPEIKIELGSHTDSFGSDSYNIDLSQRRAESAVTYIIRKGISPDRIVAKGYGESQPIAPNQHPDGSDNPEGRQRNRRTEFKILEVTPIARPFEGIEEEFDEDKYFRGN